MGERFPPVVPDSNQIDNQIGSTAPASPTHSDLATLVGDVPKFAAERWGRSVHRHRVPHPHDLLSLLSVSAVDELLDRSLRVPMARVAAAGRRVGESEYTTTVRVAGRELRDVVDPAALRSRFDDGHTIVLQALQRTWSPIRRFARDLETELDHPVQVNAYLSPPHASGLARHRDVHDVIAVQMEGEKQWSVDGVGDVTMVAGDVMYIPRGVAHVAWTESRHSLHLTVGIPAISYRDVVRRVVERLDSASLDRPLPIGFTRSDGETLDAMRSALSEVANAIVPDDATVRAIVEREHGRVRARRRRAVANSFSTTIAASSVDEHTLLAKRPDAEPRLLPASDTDDRCALTIGDGTLWAPAGVRPAFEAILDLDVLDSTDLPMLTTDGAVVLLKRLVREGVLIVVPER